MVNFFIGKAVEPLWFSVRDRLFSSVSSESELCCDLLILKLVEKSPVVFLYDRNVPWISLAAPI